jgi:prophage regulatory protein
VIDRHWSRAQAPSARETVQQGKPDGFAQDVLQAAIREQRGDHKIEPKFQKISDIETISLSGSCQDGTSAIGRSAPMNNKASARIIMASERRDLIPYSDMHISRMEKAGTFPKRIKLGPNRVGWSLSEVLDWIEARKAERQVR